MGAGKTTVGKLLARRLYRDFIDIDEEIEKAFGLPIPEIFKTYGEKAFRDKERELIQAFGSQPLLVISVGGGAFLKEENRNYCLANCIVLFFDISWDSWKERIHVLTETRPLLKDKTLQEMEQLFRERQSIYAANHSEFQVDNFEATEAAEYLADSLKLSWDIHAPQA
ncbi:shikimate kinase [Planococcus rifietoensis]|uniref:Shikimate kinase n=1 Tax=Planococcus rifietoensis TaxID=200991 RepID=A0A0U2XV67_9BACL|nr:shikimate kinase [Planococcus rifietoensis]ALS77027.1 shikimate kinase [Planococcus rifietoensis]